MKNAVILSCFGWYERRLYYIKELLEKKGYHVTVYISDFIHITKSRCIEQPDEAVQLVHVPGYKKNISFMRMYSHYTFSRKCKRSLKELKPEVIYALIPPNTVGKIASDYKKKNPETKLYVDLIDMWPESFPIQKISKTFIYKWWQKLRDTSLDLADQAVVECEYYQSQIKEQYAKKSKILRLYKNVSPSQQQVVMDAIASCADHADGKRLQLCYLGSINSLIDVDKIQRLLASLCEKGVSVCLHVIGEGSSKERFLAAAQSTGCEVQYHGVVLDEQKKAAILLHADYALNIMIDSVKVGLTLKSLDYLSLGLPLINNIKGDTWNLVERYNMGINWDADTDKMCEMLLRGNIKELKKNAYRCFAENLSKESFENMAGKIL